MLAFILVSLINDPILLYEVRWMQIESAPAHRLITMTSGLYYHQEILLGNGAELPSTCNGSAVNALPLTNLGLPTQSIESHSQE